MYPCHRGTMHLSEFGEMHSTVSKISALSIFFFNSLECAYMANTFNQIQNKIKTKPIVWECGYGRSRLMKVRTVNEIRSKRCSMMWLSNQYLLELSITSTLLFYSLYKITPSLPKQDTYRKIAHSNLRAHTCTQSPTHIHKNEQTHT